MNTQNFGWLNNITVLENSWTHNVQTNIKLVEKLLNKKFDNEPTMGIKLSDDDKQFADDYLKKGVLKKMNLLLDSILVVLH